MKSICIVEFPSNLGLTMLQPGREPGVKYLPDWLREHDFHQHIHPESTMRLDPPEYSGVKDPESGIWNADAIAAYAFQQANVLTNLLDDDKFPIAIGGDCSIVIGPAIALKQRGNYALFYLDGHTDFMDISLSASGGAAGMAASIVAGRGHEKLADILNLSPYIKEEHIWCVGNREYDDAYEDEIRNSKATYKSLDRLREKGIEQVVNSFLDAIQTRQLDGFWLHIDVDVLNDDIMPCVDSRTPDGLTYPEFNEVLYHLLQSELLTGMDITILDPELDRKGKYTEAFVMNIATVVKRAL
ncbi:arginase family protein [Pedobacter immunditicola]|uniref:arginase family protein n=1 Tax=Pedobacter immunditicola TaxID=3133440 RepID=UPI0030AA2071